MAVIAVGDVRLNPSRLEWVTVVITHMTSGSCALMICKLIECIWLKLYFVTKSSNAREEDIQIEQQK